MTSLAQTMAAYSATGCLLRVRLRLGTFSLVYSNRLERFEAVSFVGLFLQDHDDTWRSGITAAQHAK
eukprot:2672670-Amphidinium_carterae.1